MLNSKERCAVFLDIDKTLTSERFFIPEENINAIKRAREKGHAVFINTGRSWGNIPDKLREQFDVDGIIAGSGAYAVVDDKVIFSRKIPEGTVLKAAEYIFGHRENWMILEGKEKCYVLSNEKRKAESPQIAVESIEELKLLLENDEIQVIAVESGVPDEFIAEFSDELSFFPMGYYYDCVSKGLNKASGIRTVIDALGIKRENTIAIGDGGNDIDMIRFAGIGVAMKNAQPHILEAADYITDSNTECGVAKAIEKFLL